MNIVGTGLTGLVGSRVVSLLSPRYQCTNYSLENGIDITDKDRITDLIIHANASWVFHFAAYTNVQQAEEQRALGEESIAWKVNVKATEYIVAAAKQSGKKVVYIDTDYAFDGTINKQYGEEEVPHPLGWYATTKSEGAKRVLTLGDDSLVLRIANPYRAFPVGKTDFVHKILERLRSKETVLAPSDQLFVPTFIDDIAVAVDQLISQHAHGIYHVVSPTAVSPFEAAKTIATVYKADASLVVPTTFRLYFENRAPVPQYAWLSDKKLRSIGVATHDFLSGLSAVYRQETE